MIVIASTPGSPWLAECLDSLGTDREFMVLSNYKWEMGKIRFMFEYTKVEEFVLLHDSCVFKDPDFIDWFFDFDSSVALSNCPVPFGMYMGKYRRETLQKVNLPWVQDKNDSIHFERAFADEYCRAEPGIPTLFPEFHDRNATRTEEKNGRLNLVLENQYLIKYKGTWW